MEGTESDSKQVDPDVLFERLGEVALIAGRMAHDFDNILTGIIGFADLSRPLLQPGTPLAKYVGEIGKVGQRGVVFTQQLHRLSQSGQANPAPGSVAEAWSAELARVQPQLPSTVSVESDVPRNLPPAQMEVSLLGIVLGHLLDNAIEAVPAAGPIRVTANTVDLEPSDSTRFLGKVRSGPHLEVAIADRGPGVKPAVRKKLFVEPFFTTKVRHRGLGLAIVYRNLYAHHGGIRLESVPPPDTGTIARVVIPAVSPGSTPIGQRSGGEKSSGGSPR